MAGTGRKGLKGEQVATGDGKMSLKGYRLSGWISDESFLLSSPHGL